uniref:Uncharacterized protein n=1 Tax=Oryza punctata TaxID=4537 RepID=A0A0E0LQS1_ORYPU
MTGGEAVAIYIDHGVPDEAQATLKDMKERMTKRRLLEDSHGATIAQSKIHRFPRGLRGIGGADERYIVPTVVAIGPYYHGELHLQDMEEAKLAAANHLFAGSVEHVYGKLLSSVGDARGCYDDDEKVRGISDADFAAMMLVDGCFLLHLSRPGSALSSDHSILKDVMLLENQIPWLVLDTLMEFLGVNVDVRSFVAGLGDKFFPKKKKDKGGWSRCIVNGVWIWVTSCQRGNLQELERGIVNGGRSYESYRPAHLLGLLRFSQIWQMPEEEINYVPGNTSLLSSSAVELAQIGVKLTASSANWFADMRLVREKRIFGEFLLSPVFLNDVTACWLVNMAALEAATGGGGASCNVDDYGPVVSSYLSALAMLMDREEDVHELRGHRVVLSTFSNTQTLDLFKRIGQHLSLGGRYFVVLEQIEAYRRNRPARTKVYKFLYKYRKEISIILSIVSAGRVKFWNEAK